MKRVTAILTAILLCSAFICGCAFIVLEKNHECYGEGCHVCFCIALCQNVIRNLTYHSQNANSSISALILFTVIITSAKILVLPSTLITLKVKLTDLTAQNSRPDSLRAMVMCIHMEDLFMRKIFSLFTASFLAVMSASPVYAARITVSIFLVYDWVREISKGVSNDITILLDSGADLHSYQPSAEDIMRIAESDLFVYVGGESDEWAENALKIPGKKSRRVISLLDILGSNVKPEEIVEGMQDNHEHHHEHEEHEHESAHEHHEHEHEEPDEHMAFTEERGNNLPEIS